MAGYSTLIEARQSDSSSTQKSSSPIFVDVLNARHPTFAVGCVNFELHLQDLPEIDSECFGKFYLSNSINQGSPNVVVLSFDCLFRSDDEQCLTKTLSAKSLLQVLLFILNTKYPFELTPK